MGKRILVHCCCGPCATSSIRRLIDEGYEPVLCYGNSNIWPQKENDIRYENIPEAFARMGAGNLVSLYSKARQTDFFIAKFLCVCV